MQTRNLVLAAAAVLLLGLPVVVGAQSAPVAVKAGDKKAPKMVGGSGKSIPRGAVEVVQAGPGAGIAGRTGPSSALDNKSLGRIIEDVDGAVFQGPCELATTGGVSYFVPEGASVQCSVAADGTVTFTPLKGSVFARNEEAMVTVAVGGSISSSMTGRFTGVTGDGSVGSGDGNFWMGFSGASNMDDIMRMFADMAMYRNIRTTQGAVSSNTNWRW